VLRSKRAYRRRHCQALCWFTRASDAGHNWAKERLAEEQANAPETKAAAKCE